jgi:ABC-type lipoprotein release transport system permease subunit
MSAFAMRARADMRARSTSLILLTLFTGLVGAVAMGSVAAARRTDSAYDRYRIATREPEVVLVGCPQTLGFGAPAPFEQAAELPQVASWSSAWITPVGLFFAADGKTPLFFRDAPEGQIEGPTDPGGMHELGSPLILEGRAPERANEVAIGWGTTDGPRAHVGDTVVLRLINVHHLDRAMRYTGHGEPPRGAFLPPLRLNVVGEYIPFGGLNGDDSGLVASAPFVQANRRETVGCTIGAFHLRGGLQDADPFLRGVSAIQPGVNSFDLSDEAVVASGKTHLVAIGARLFGMLVAIAGALVLGQALVRRVVLGANEDPILRALGMTRRQVANTALIPGAIVGVVGALIAAVATIAVSPLTPLGFARFIEPTPGIDVDAPILAIGGCLIIVGAATVSWITGWRMAGARAGVLGTAELVGAGRPSRIAAAFARAGMPPAAVAGSRLALEPGHGHTAVPVRSAVMGLAIAVAAMVGAFGFAASAVHFGSTPRLWGIEFGFAAGHPYIGSRFQDKAIPAVEQDPGFDAVTAGNFQNALDISGPAGGAHVFAWALEPLRGPLVHTTMREGRWPERSDELALGEETARSLGVGIGDQVAVQAGQTKIPMTIVGIPVFPDVGFGGGLGQGAAMTMDGLHRFYPDATQNLVLATFTAGADVSATFDRVNEVLEPLGASTVEGDVGSQGFRVQDALRSERLPLLVAALFAVVAFGTLVHLLISSVRRRRRDLAILRTLGFKKGQVMWTVAWQSATLAAVALAIGVPAGVLLGRLAWDLFADRLGVIVEPVIAWRAVVFVVPLTIALAVSVGLGPAIAARRTRPAVVLRAE